MSRSRPLPTLAALGWAALVCSLQAARAADPAPPPAEAPAAAPADAAPTGADTVFTFSGEVPTGWTAEGKVLAHQAVLVVGDGSGAVSLLCTPMQAAGGPVTATVTRAFVVPEGESDTWSRVEARVFGPDTKPIAGASPQLLSAIKVGTTMSAAPYTFTPPAGASTWRRCLKTGGAARGSTVVKEIRIR